MATTQDRLKSIDEKMARLKAQRKDIVARENKQARKDRTHNLIQKGALAEQFLPCKDMPVKQFEALLAGLVALPGVGKYLSGFTARQSAPMETDTGKKNLEPAPDGVKKPGSDADNVTRQLY